MEKSRQNYLRTYPKSSSHTWGAGTELKYDYASVQADPSAKILSAASASRSSYGNSEFESNRHLLDYRGDSMMYGGNGPQPSNSLFNSPLERIDYRYPQSQDVKRDTFSRDIVSDAYDAKDRFGTRLSYMGSTDRRFSSYLGNTDSVSNELPSGSDMARVTDYGHKSAIFEIESRPISFSSNPMKSKNADDGLFLQQTRLEKEYSQFLDSVTSREDEGSRFPANQGNKRKRNDPYLSDQNSQRKKVSRFGESYDYERKSSFEEGRYSQTRRENDSKQPLRENRFEKFDSGKGIGLLDRPGEFEQQSSRGQFDQFTRKYDFNQLQKEHGFTQPNRGSGFEEMNRRNELEQMTRRSEVRPMKIGDDSSQLTSGNNFGRFSLEGDFSQFNRRSQYDGDQKSQLKGVGRMEGSNKYGLKTNYEKSNYNQTRRENVSKQPQRGKRFEKFHGGNAIVHLNREGEFEQRSERSEHDQLSRRNESGQLHRESEFMQTNRGNEFQQLNRENELGQMNWRNELRPMSMRNEANQFYLASEFNQLNRGSQFDELNSGIEINQMHKLNEFSQLRGDNNFSQLNTGTVMNQLSSGNQFDQANVGMQLNQLNMGSELGMLNRGMQDVGQWNKSLDLNMPNMGGNFSQTTREGDLNFMQMRQDGGFSVEHTLAASQQNSNLAGNPNMMWNQNPSGGLSTALHGDREHLNYSMDLQDSLANTGGGTGLQTNINQFNTGDWRTQRGLLPSPTRDFQLSDSYLSQDPVSSRSQRTQSTSITDHGRSMFSGLSSMGRERGGSSGTGWSLEKNNRSRKEKMGQKLNQPMERDAKGRRHAGREGGTFGHQKIDRNETWTERGSRREGSAQRDNSSEGRRDMFRRSENPRLMNIERGYSQARKRAGISAEKEPMVSSYQQMKKRRLSSERRADSRGRLQESLTQAGGSKEPHKFSSSKQDDRVKDVSPESIKAKKQSGSYQRSADTEQLRRLVDYVHNHSSERQNPVWFLDNAAAQVGVDIHYYSTSKRGKAKTVNQSDGKGRLLGGVVETYDGAVLFKDIVLGKFSSNNPELTKNNAYIKARKTLFTLPVEEIMDVSIFSDSMKADVNFQSLRWVCVNSVGKPPNPSVSTKVKTSMYKKPMVDTKDSKAELITDNPPNSQKRVGDEIQLTTTVKSVTSETKLAVTPKNTETKKIGGDVGSSKSSIVEKKASEKSANTDMKKAAAATDNSKTSIVEKKASEKSANADMKNAAVGSESTKTSIVGKTDVGKSANTDMKKTAAATDNSKTSIVDKKVSEKSANTDVKKTAVGSDSSKTSTIEKKAIVQSANADTKRTVGGPGSSQSPTDKKASEKSANTDIKKVASSSASSTTSIVENKASEKSANADTKKTAGVPSSLKIPVNEEKNVGKSNGTVLKKTAAGLSSSKTCTDGNKNLTTKLEDLVKRIETIRQASSCATAFSNASKQLKIEICVIFLKQTDSPVHCSVTCEIFLEETFVASAQASDKSKSKENAYKQVCDTLTRNPINTLANTGRRLCLQDRLRPDVTGILFEGFQREHHGNAKTLKSVGYYPVDFSRPFKNMVVIETGVKKTTASDEYKMLIQMSVANAMLMEYTVEPLHREGQTSYVCKMFIQQKLITESIGATEQEARQRGASDAVKSLYQTQDVIKYVPLGMPGEEHIFTLEKLKEMAKKKKEQSGSEKGNIDEKNEEGLKWLTMTIEEILANFVKEITLQEVAFTFNLPDQVSNVLSQTVKAHGLHMHIRGSNKSKYWSVNKKKRMPDEIVKILQLCGGKSGQYQLVNCKSPLSNEDLAQIKSKYLADEPLTN